MAAPTHATVGLMTNPDDLDAYMAEAAAAAAPAGSETGELVQQLNGAGLPAHANAGAGQQGAAQQQQAAQPDDRDAEIAALRTLVAAEKARADAAVAAAQQQPQQLQQTQLMAQQALRPDADVVMQQAPGGAAAGPSNASGNAMTQQVGGGTRKSRKFPKPATFKPPANDAKPAEAIRLIEKYIYDLKNYYTYGGSADDGIPATAAFSGTSEGTFDLVQVLEREQTRQLAAGQGMMTIDQVCERVKSRYMPLENPEQHSRAKLLSGGYRQGERTVAQYHGDFLVEAAKAGYDFEHEQDMKTLTQLFLNGLYPELRAVCQAGADDKLFTSLPPLYQHALAKERELNALNKRAPRNRAMTTQNNGGRGGGGRKPRPCGSA